MLVLERVLMKSTESSVNRTAADGGKTLTMRDNLINKE